MDNLKPPKTPTNWDQRFLQVASIFAGWSKDPSTKVGAVAVRERRILAQGYNGLPAGVADSDVRLKNRETRLEMTVHAEMNCVAYAAQNGVSLMGATMYVWPLMTCSRCASMLIQAGINKVVVPDFVEPQRGQVHVHRGRGFRTETSHDWTRQSDGRFVNGVAKAAELTTVAFRSRT